MDKPKDQENELIPYTCGCSRGKLRKGFTKYMVEIGNEVIIIRNFRHGYTTFATRPNEAYISPQVSEKIDEIVRAFRAGKLLA
jgi:hypothetical protein